MKYAKGTQGYKIGEDSELPTWKARLHIRGEGEGIWVNQGEDEVVLLNDSIFFYPYRSWGGILPSNSNPRDTSTQRENIDMAPIRGVGGQPSDDCVLTLHPEAWDQYLEHGFIDENGNPTKKMEINDE